MMLQNDRLTRMHGNAVSSLLVRYVDLTSIVIYFNYQLLYMVRLTGDNAISGQETRVKIETLFYQSGPMAPHFSSMTDLSFESLQFHYHQR